MNNVPNSNSPRGLRGWRGAVVVLSLILNALFAYSVMFKWDVRGSLRRIKQSFSSADDLATNLPARWHRRTHGADQEKEEGTEDRQTEIQRLESIGYMAGYQKAGDAQDVTRYDPDRAFIGYNFVVSGHGPEAALVDMNGQLLHRWGYACEDAFPEYEPPEGINHHQFWRRARLLDDGSVVAIFEGIGMVKLDRDSRLIWVRRNKAHHDLQVLPDGRLYVLTREARMIPEYNPDTPILEDFISVLDTNGEELQRVSLLEAMANSRYAPMLHDELLQGGDVFHTNSLQLLDGRQKDRMGAFESGRVLVSILYLHAAAVVDLTLPRVEWALSGMWRRQHETSLLANGNLLLFDNLGPGPDRSRVLEVNPLTQEVVWQYGGTGQQPLFSGNCGTTARLGNGNTMIVESNSGRALEVTVDGEVVWEYLNPHRAGPGGELIASLFDVIRIDPAQTRSWLSVN